MAAPDQEPLIEAAMKLRSTAPQLWDSFVAALQTYSDGMNAQMMSCAPDMLMRAQGMAIATAEITTVMREAPAMYAKIQEHRRRKPVQHGRQPTFGT
jgi:hypothetical protein